MQHHQQATTSGHHASSRTSSTTPQLSLAIEPLPAAACPASTVGQPGHSSSSSSGGGGAGLQQPPSLAEPLCGAFDAATGHLFVGCSAGSVSCLSLGHYGCAARRVLGRHAGRVTGMCLFPWAPQTQQKQQQQQQQQQQKLAQQPDAVAASTHATGGSSGVLPGHSLFASCSADGTIKVWTSDAKALHATDACLQTLRGHKAAVTSVAAVQVAHTWCLVSGGSDGLVLLWVPAGSGYAAGGLKQVPGAAALAQLLPHMQLSQPPLWSSSHWVLGLTCQPQPSDAGASQGVFAVLARQPLMQLHIDRQAVGPPGALTAAPAAAAAGAAGPAGRCSSRLSTARPRPSVLCGSVSMGGAQATGTRLVPGAAGSTCGSAVADAIAAAGSGIKPQQPRCANTRPTSGSSSSSTTTTTTTTSSEFRSPAASLALPWSRGLNLFAARLIPQHLAVATLSYDGCCRLHSLVEVGGATCCWRSPTGSCYTALDVAQPLQQDQGQMLLLLGDDRGCLHLYCLGTERLLATKQVSRCKITAIVCCGAQQASGAAARASGGSQQLQIAVLSQQGTGLWQLRQGFSHSIVPGGHRQGLIALQACCASGTPALLATSGGSGGCSADMRTPGSAGMLISAGLDNKVIQWDLSTAVPAAVQSIHVAAAAAAAAAGAGGCEVTAVAYLQDCGILATGHDNSQVLLWRMDTGSHSVLGPQGHTNAVSSLAPAVTAKGDELLLSGGFDGFVCLWEPRTLRGIKPHLLARFCASPTDGSLPPPAGQRQRHQPTAQQQPSAAGSASRRLSRHPSTTGAPGHTGCTLATAAPAGRHRGNAVALTQASGRLQLAVGAAGSVSRGGSSSSTSNNTTAGSRTDPGSRQGRDAAAAGSMAVLSTALPAAAAPAGAAAPGQDGHAEDGHAAVAPACIALHGMQPPEVLVVLFEPLQQAILTGGNDGLVKAWAGCASGQALGVHTGHTGPVTCLAVDGNLLFSGSQDCSIRMWDAVPRAWLAAAGAGARPIPCSSSAAFRVLGGHTAPVTGLAVAPASGLLVSCGQDGQLLQHNYFTGQLLSRCGAAQGPGGALSSLALVGDVAGWQGTQPGCVYVGTAGGQLLCFEACREPPALPDVCVSAMAG